MQSRRELCGSRVYLPGEQVGGETPLQERRRARLVLLGREELEAESRVGVKERSIFVHAADDEQAAVEDANRRRVPAPLLKVKSSGIFKHRAALSSRRSAWLENTDSLGAVFDTRITWEAVRIAADADLESTPISL